MDCEQFRSRYSEFADGQLDERSEVELHRHMAECVACRRLHAAYRAGCRELRHLRRLCPSADFGERLSARIGEGPAVPARRRPALVAALALAVVVGGAGTWLGVLGLMTGPGGVTARVAPSGGLNRSPFTVRFAGDTSYDYPGHFPIIPVSRDSFARHPVRPAAFEITVDWMQP